MVCLPGITYMPVPENFNIDLFAMYNTNFFMVAALLPVLMRVMFFMFSKKFTEIFMLLPLDCFPFAILLNVFFRSEGMKPQMNTVPIYLGLLLPVVEWSSIPEAVKGNLYILSRIVAHSLTLFAVILFDVPSPKVEVMNRGMFCKPLKNMLPAEIITLSLVTAALIISLSTPVSRERAALNSPPGFELCGFMIMLSLIILPFQRISLKTRLDVLNILSVSFSIFCHFIFDLENLPSSLRIMYIASTMGVCLFSLSDLCLSKAVHDLFGVPSPRVEVMNRGTSLIGIGRYLDSFLDPSFSGAVQFLKESQQAVEMFGDTFQSQQQNTKTDASTSYHGLIKFRERGQDEAHNDHVDSLLTSTHEKNSSADSGCIVTDDKQGLNEVVHLHNGTSLLVCEEPKKIVSDFSFEGEGRYNECSSDIDEDPREGSDSECDSEIHEEWIANEEYAEYVSEIEEDENKRIFHESKEKLHAKYMMICVCYCSLFAPEYEFTMDILIWSLFAAGFLVEEGTDQLAIRCMNALIKKECVVESGYDRLSDQMMYRYLGYKDTTFPYRNSVGLGFRTNLDSDTGLSGTKHLSLIFKSIDHLHIQNLKRCHNLKTLILHGAKMANTLDDLFSGLKLLTKLDLSQTNITVLPSSVENLTALRYLDMSHTLIRWLPASIDLVTNLETLILHGCVKLGGLPKGMYQLINLKHLALDIGLLLHSMPPEIGKLVQLQNLKAFPVGRKDGNRISELRNMNQLRGSLCIWKLENIENKEEAELARLCDKQYITKLEFLWSDCQDSILVTEEEILENLRPHPCLKELKIGYYSGGVFPSWISDPSFSQIVNITISWCRYCEKLPCLGMLQSLKFLGIIEMDEVVNIDDSFCREKLNQGPFAFPKLEKLLLEGMSNLENWTGIQEGDFSCLESIRIKYCPKLVSLPSNLYVNSLQYLEIRNCPELPRLAKGALSDSVKYVFVLDI